MGKPKSETQNPNQEEGRSKRGPAARPYDLRERSFQFALRIIQIAASLPKSPEAQIIRRQLVKSGTSIGANVEEADGATSRPDTRRSFVIAKKEAQETRYWLRIVAAAWSLDVSRDLQEALELTRILGSIIHNLS